LGLKTKLCQIPGTAEQEEKKQFCFKSLLPLTALVPQLCRCLQHSWTTANKGLLNPARRLLFPKYPSPTREQR